MSSNLPAAGSIKAAAQGADAAWRMPPSPARAGNPTGGDAAGVITLRGSTEQVVEFFSYAINSILYQRGICSADRFQPVQQYGLTIMVTTDKELQDYLAEVMGRVRGWMLRSQVKEIVMAIASRRTGETLERWRFDVIVDQEAAAAPSVPLSRAEVVACQKEIQAIIRQVTASVTFLPLLDEPCTYNLLITTDRLAEEPLGWGESDPMNIVGEYQEVKLKSFSTKVHRVDGAVAYKFDG